MIQSPIMTWMKNNFIATENQEDRTTIFLIFYALFNYFEPDPKTRPY